MNHTPTPYLYLDINKLLATHTSMESMSMET